MATIRCKACGKIYSYEKEGCCPGCGAYNRPPKRERVNADGTIQHMTDAAYEKRSKAAGKVCFEEKECYEEKVCYEDQARHSPRTVPQGNVAPKPTGPVPHSKFPQTRSVPVKSTAGQKKKTPIPLGCLIPLIIWAVPTVLGLLAALIGSILRSLGLF